MSDPPFPNLCSLISCHQLDILMGWAAGTAGSLAMLNSEGIFTVTTNCLLVDGTVVSLTITVTKD
jgi:hypothetical protein